MSGWGVGVVWIFIALMHGGVPSSTSGLELWKYKSDWLCDFCAILCSLYVKASLRSVE